MSKTLDLDCSFGARFRGKASEGGLDGEGNMAHVVYIELGER